MIWLMTLGYVVVAGVLLTASLPSRFSLFFKVIGVLVVTGLRRVRLVPVRRRELRVASGRRPARQRRQRRGWQRGGSPPPRNGQGDLEGRERAAV